MATKKGDPTPLTKTRQADERMREEWMRGLARDSMAGNWNDCEIRMEVEKGVSVAVAVQNIRKPKAASNLAREGRLAAHPDVRGHFEQLVTFRDVLWSLHAAELKPRIHGPSQLLVDLMMCQREPQERHHTATMSAYLAFRRNLPKKARRKHYKPTTVTPSPRKTKLRVVYSASASAPASGPQP
jgi:hypothetical protein